MPTALGPLVGFGAGALLAYLARAYDAPEKGAIVSKNTLAALLFAALVYAPACAYFIVFAPDWALFYAIDSRRVPSALSLLVVIADALAVGAGFVASARQLRRGMHQASLLLAALPFAAAIGAALLFAHDLRIDGTYRQVHADFGVEPVAGGPLGWAILLMLALVVAGFVVTQRAITARPPKAPVEPAAPARLLGRGKRR